MRPNPRPGCTAVFCMACVQLHGAAFGEHDFAAADATADTPLCWLCRPPPPAGGTDLVRRDRVAALRRTQLQEGAQRGRSGRKAAGGRKASTKPEKARPPRKNTALSARGGLDTDEVFYQHRPLPAVPPYSVGAGGAPYILLENVSGMTDVDCNVVQTKLGLDWLYIDSLVFSYFRRQRYYFANFACSGEDTLPSREDSPRFQPNVPDAKGRALTQRVDYEIDERFGTDEDGQPSNPKKYLKLNALLPRRDWTILDKLNTKLAAGERLDSDDIKKAKQYSFVWYTDPVRGSQLRELSVAEVDGGEGMGFPVQRGGRAWTHVVTNEQWAYDFLGNSFQVDTIMWRLRPIAEKLRRRDPLVVLSLCDGIGGCLAALLRLLGEGRVWSHCRFRATGT
jgi:hypothetical protein